MATPLLEWQDVVQMGMLCDGLFEVIVPTQAVYRGGITSLSVQDNLLLIEPSWIVHRRRISIKDKRPGDQPKSHRCRARSIAVNLHHTKPMLVSSLYVANDEMSPLTLGLFSPRAKPFDLAPEAKTPCGPACDSDRLIID